MVNKKAVILKTSAVTKTVEITDEFDVDNFDYELIKPHFKKIGKGDIERQCSWELDEYLVSVFGWKNGKAGRENKTELPPPEDNDIFFGDILAVKSDKTGKLLDFTKSDFKEFFEIAYGGFESLGSEDTSDPEDYDEESDDSFIVNSDVELEIDEESEEEEYVSSSSEESSNDESDVDFATDDDEEYVPKKYKKPVSSESSSDDESNSENSCSNSEKEVSSETIVLNLNTEETDK